MNNSSFFNIPGFIERINERINGEDGEILLGEAKKVNLMFDPLKALKNFIDKRAPYSLERHTLYQQGELYNPFNPSGKMGYIELEKGKRTSSPAEEIHYQELTLIIKKDQELKPGDIIPKGSKVTIYKEAVQLLDPFQRKNSIASLEDIIPTHWLLR